jgi:hypothetical protein
MGSRAAWRPAGDAPKPTGRLQRGKRAGASPLQGAAYSEDKNRLRVIRFATGAFHRFTETAKHSRFYVFRAFERKTAEYAAAIGSTFPESALEKRPFNRNRCFAPFLSVAALSRKTVACLTRANSISV